MATASLSEGTAASILNRAGPQGDLADLCATLGDFELLAFQVSSLKMDTLEKEAGVLKEVLDRIAPLVPILSKKYEAFYRPVLVVLTQRDEIPLPRSEGAYFFSEHRLALYEDGSLVRTHRFGQWTGGPQPGWELAEEDELTPDAAIAAFGLPAIAEGFIKAFQEAHSTTILKDELEGRLAALTRVLEVIQ
ncbi:MAG: hypothetical protein NTU95_05525 [Methanothrix sp.]|nr:hypothetical protein [Methanothrix sp.]